MFKRMQRGEPDEELMGVNDILEKDETKTIDDSEGEGSQPTMDVDERVPMIKKKRRAQRKDNSDTSDLSAGEKRSTQGRRGPHLRV